MGAGRTEFELKFTGPPDTVAALPSSPFFAALAPNGGQWERLSSTYFDTPEGVLAAAGISLRRRDEGAITLQAVKMRGDSPAARTEYETELDNDARFPVATGSRKLDEMIATVAGDLVVIASTQVDRWFTVVSFRGARIELAVDLGRAERRIGAGPPLSGPIAEVELELIEGSREAVFDFARLLLRNAPLRLAAGSKLDAALALGSSSIPKYRLRPGKELACAGDMLTGSLAGAAMRLASLQSPTIDVRRPEGVHQIRVALRRLRTSERVFRRDHRSDDIKRLAERAKSIGAALAPARDWDVFIEETIAVVGADQSAPPGLKHLKAAAERKRAEAWAQAVETVSSDAFTLFLLDLLEAGTLQHWRLRAGKALDKPASGYAPPALDRARGKAMKTARALRAGDISAENDPAALHPLRIALKKLRYPLQTFKSQYPGDARKDYMKALSTLQSMFGAVNDAVTAQALADQASEGGGEEVMRAAGFVSGYKAAEARHAAQEIDAAWAAFEKMTPFWKQD